MKQIRLVRVFVEIKYSLEYIRFYLDIADEYLNNRAEFDRKAAEMIERNLISRK